MSNEWRYNGKSDCAPLHYNWCGLDDVFLVSGYECHQTDDGEDVVIQDLDGLHRAIGLHLAEHKKALNGKEIRFLRHAMDLTQSELSDLLGVNDQTVARWEKQETDIPAPAELLLRVLFLGHVHKKVDVRELATELREKDSPSVERQVFTEKNGVWVALTA